MTPPVPGSVVLHATETPGYEAVCRVETGYCNDCFNEKVHDYPTTRVTYVPLAALEAAVAAERERWRKVAEKCVEDELKYWDGERGLSPMDRFLPMIREEK